MKKENQNLELDEVLIAFQHACSDPTAANIVEWAKKYPRYTEEIISHAAMLKDFAAAEKLGFKPDARMVSIAQSRTMDLLHKARAAAKSESVLERTFDEILQATGTNIPDLARSLDIARSVLADLVNGRMRLPVGARLADALMQAWKIPIETIQKAAFAALAKPRLGMAKADQNAKVNALSYEELVNASSMSESRKKFWLGED